MIEISMPSYGREQLSEISRGVQDGRIDVGLSGDKFFETVAGEAALAPDEVKPFVKRDAAKFVKSFGLCALTKGLLMLMRARFGRATSFNIAFKGPAPAWCYPDKGTVYVNFSEAAAYHPSMVKALILHELGHIAFTKYDPETDRKRTRNSAMASLVNILEDRYIETRVAADIRFADDQFTRLHGVYLSAIYEGKTYTQPRALLYVLSLAPCAIYHGINGGGMDWRTFLDRLAIKTGFNERDEAFCDAWWDFARKAQNASDSGEIVAMAEEFYGLFEDYFPKGESPDIDMPTAKSGEGGGHESGGPDESEGGGEQGDTETTDMTSEKEVDELEKANAPPEAGVLDKLPKKAIARTSRRPAGARDVSTFWDSTADWGAVVADGTQFARKVSARVESLSAFLRRGDSLSHVPSGTRLDVRKAIRDMAESGYPREIFREAKKAMTEAPLLALDCVIDCSGSMRRASGIPGVSASGAAAGIGAFFLALSRMSPWVDARVFATATGNGGLLVAEFRDPRELIRLGTRGSEGFVSYGEIVKQKPGLLFVVTDGYFCNSRDMRMFEAFKNKRMLTVGLYVGQREACKNVEKNLSVFSMSKVSSELSPVFGFIGRFLDHEIRQRRLGHEAGWFSRRRQIPMPG
jgi:hypothetical protein